MTPGRAVRQPVAARAVNVYVCPEELQAPAHTAFRQRENGTYHTVEVQQNRNS